MGEITKLNLCLQELNGLELGTFLYRKLLQKKVYFLQELGLDLGYSYGFYIYGPYSSELADNAFFLLRLRNNAPANIEAVELTQAERKILDRAIAFFGEISGDDSEVASMLEIMSSLHFLWTFSYSKSKSKEEIFAKIKEKKRWVTDPCLESGWVLLTKYGLVA